MCIVDHTKYEKLEEAKFKQSFNSKINWDLSQYCDVMHTSLAGFENDNDHNEKDHHTKYMPVTIVTKFVWSSYHGIM